MQSDGFPVSKVQARRCGEGTTGDRPQPFARRAGRGRRIAEDELEVDRVDRVPRMQAECKTEAAGQSATSAGVLGGPIALAGAHDLLPSQQFPVWSTGAQ